MRFDIDKIAKQVSNVIAGKIDATEKDYSWLGAQEDALHDELEWMVDKGVPTHIFSSLITNLRNHPDILFVFEVAARQYADMIHLQNLEMQVAEAQYRKDVL